MGKEKNHDLEHHAICQPANRGLDIRPRYSVNFP